MWHFNGHEFKEENIESYYGFVYLITNLTNNKKYIGKKFFYSSKTKSVKGKRKKIKVSSDWQTYYGSNEELKNDVQELGTDKFRREIIHLCLTKGECNYLEAKEQFARNVLESDEYYNTWIFVRVHQKHISKYNDRISKTV